MFDFSSIKKGIIKAYSIPLLPENVSRVYNHIIIRILRVIGGLSVLLVLSKNYTVLLFPFNWIVLLFAVIQIVQIIIISILKITYGIRKIINNPDEFEIRNSPLNHYASLLAKLGYCWRFGCTAVGGGVGVIAGGAAIDQVLQEAGKPKIFLPLMAKAYNSVTGHTSIHNPEGVYDNYVTRIKNLSSAEERSKFIEQSLDKINKVDLSEYGLSESDTSDIKKAITEMQKQSDIDKKAIAKNIIDEIEKLKNNK